MSESSCAARERASVLVADAELELAYVHIPVPHLPAIWDRARAAPRTRFGGDYADNLDLADRTGVHRHLFGPWRADPGGDPLPRRP